MRNVIFPLIFFFLSLCNFFLLSTKHLAAEKPWITVEDLDQDAMAPTVAPTTVKTPIPSSTSRDQVQSENGFKVICYFTNWAWYRQEGGKFLPEDVDTDLCTHVLYGFAVLDGSRLKIKSHDPWADIDNSNY